MAGRHGSGMAMAGTKDRTEGRRRMEKRRRRRRRQMRGDSGIKINKNKNSLKNLILLKKLKCCICSGGVLCCSCWWRLLARLLAISLLPSRDTSRVMAWRERQGGATRGRQQYQGARVTHYCVSSGARHVLSWRGGVVCSPWTVVA